MESQPLANMANRTPARKVADVPAEVREQLSQGKLETLNLTEWLAVDRLRLLRSIVNELGIQEHQVNWASLEDASQKLAALKMSKRIAEELCEHFDVQSEQWRTMSQHPSDIVREWAALTLGRSSLTFQKKLAWMKPLADAPNAGLREIAWIALREDVIRDPEEAIKRLVPWTGSRSQNLRRFASEVTRPRGVWAAHVERLKETPELGLPILHELRFDEVKYVKDSVANWLNDASKSRPDWVSDLTQKWLAESDNKHTQYIVKRALRTIKG